jgi:hypothetical protein
MESNFTSVLDLEKKYSEHFRFYMPINNINQSQLIYSDLKNNEVETIFNKRARI